MKKIFVALAVILSCSMFSGCGVDSIADSIYKIRHSKDNAEAKEEEENAIKEDSKSDTKVSSEESEKELKTVSADALAELDAYYDSFKDEYEAYASDYMESVVDISDQLKSGSIDEQTAKEQLEKTYEEFDSDRDLICQDFLNKIKRYKLNHEVPDEYVDWFAGDLEVYFKKIDKKYNPRLAINNESNENKPGVFGKDFDEEVDKAKNEMNDAVDEVKDEMQQAVDETKDEMNKAIDDVKDEYHKEVEDSLGGKNIISDAVNSYVDGYVGNYMDNYKKAVNDSMDAYQKGYNEAMDSYLDGYNKALDSYRTSGDINKAMKDMDEGINNAMQNMDEGVNKAMENMDKGIDEALGKYKY